MVREGVDKIGRLAIRNTSFSAKCNLLAFVGVLMDYIDCIEKLIKVLRSSGKFHLLCICGAPGWAKTYTIRRVLTEEGADYQMLDIYSSPLALYNHLADCSEQILVIDDASDLFFSPKAISILNAATWSGISQSSKRTVTWPSNSEKVSIPPFEFRGKVIVLANFFPEAPQAKALIDRSLHYNIRLAPTKIPDLLLSAAYSSHFENTCCAVQVAKYLGKKALQYESHGHCPISLRTLEMGVEIAEADPESWKDLLGRLLPQADGKLSKEGVNQLSGGLISKLSTSEMTVEQQYEEFRKVTGKSRRSFFYQRKSLGLARSSRVDAQRGGLQ